MTPDQVKRSAEFLAQARLGGKKTGPLPEDLIPPSEADAYTVQAMVNKILEAGGYGDMVGHKIGCTTNVMQEFLDIDHPCSGEIQAFAVHAHDTELSLEKFHRVGVECEIAVRLGENLPATGTRYDKDNTLPAVESVMASIELVDDRYEDSKSHSAATIIADDFFGAGIVLGTPNRDFENIDLSSVKGEMWVDGESVGTGTGADILGHPLNALAWLANHRIALDKPLRAGEIVTLGSLVKTVFFDAPAEVEIELEHLGRVAVRFI